MAEAQNSTARKQRSPSSGSARISPQVASDNAPKALSAAVLGVAGRTITPDTPHAKLFTAWRLGGRIWTKALITLAKEMGVPSSKKALLAMMERYRWTELADTIEAEERRLTAMQAVDMGSALEGARNEFVQDACVLLRNGVLLASLAQAQQLEMHREMGVVSAGGIESATRTLQGVIGIGLKLFGMEHLAVKVEQGGVDELSDEQVRAIRKRLAPYIETEGVVK